MNGARIKKGAPRSRHPFLMFFNRQASALARDFARNTINIIIERLEQLTVVQGLASRNTGLASIILDWASEDLDLA